ncbi:MAG: hypothetical protein J7M25_04695 [Deltaproteobacteria bacterium]|nr:hypothetical protein [Deltaproteobacteria bacterium]
MDKHSGLWWRLSVVFAFALVTVVGCSPTPSPRTVVPPPPPPPPPASSSTAARTAPPAVRAQTVTYPAPLLRSTNSVVVDALAYVHGHLVGEMLPVRLTVGPNPDQDPNVAIAGDLSGGLGGSWRAGVWMAAYQASTAVGRDLPDYAIVARGKGLVDGPSASALMTAGLMAAMMHLPVRRAFTMTGTVNPDGTVGPVGGIPNKFRRAIKAGKKILGYPVGQRFSRDEVTHKLIDLRAMGQQAGVQVVEIATVYDAFAFLTGRRFPMPAALSRDEMALGQGMFPVLQGRISKWQSIFGQYFKGFLSQKVTGVNEAKRRITVAARYMKASSQFLKEGSVAAAYDAAARGGGWAYTAYWFARFLRLAYRRQFKEMFQAVKALGAVNQKIARSLAKLRVVRPTSMDSLMALIASYEQMVEGWAYARQGDRMTQLALAKIRHMSSVRSAQRIDPRGLLLQWLYAAAFQYALAEIKQGKAADFLKLHGPRHMGRQVTAVRLRQVAKVFLSAAQANLVYFERIFVPMFVKYSGKSQAQVKRVLRMKLSKYLLASHCLRFPQYVLAKAWGKNSTETALAEVAGSMGSYFNSSMLIIKYYSLGMNMARKFKGLSVRDVPRLKALVAMLRHAERTTRVYAALAKRYAGSVPVSAKVFYLVGMTMKEMQPVLKVKALEMFWRASMECQLAMMLSRSSGGARNGR